jgi:serine/threonine protein kinase
MSEGGAPKRGGGKTNDSEKFVETQYQSGSSPAAPSSTAAVGKHKDPLIGTSVSGYVVKGRIGSGGMGIVYEGEQPVIGKRVAIKVLRPEIAENPEQVKRLVEEARAVNTVGHRGIIDVFGFGEMTDGRQCIVMEFLDGEALMDLLTRNQKEHRAMPIAEVMIVLEELLSALGAAHGAGVVHRDLKPSNIFLCRQRDGSRYVKILDFGIAKLGVHGTTPQTQASMLVGTPSYMAPEQARGGGISPALDLYAVGIIAFEMLTGQLPFLGASVVEVLMKHAEEPPPRPSSLLMSIPDDVDDLILKLLEKKPEDRYLTAEAVRVDVVRIRKALSDSTARRTELDLEIDKRLKKRLKAMVLPDNARALDLGDGDDATLPPSVRGDVRPLEAETRALPALPPEAFSSDTTAKSEVIAPPPPEVSNSRLPTLMIAAAAAVVLVAGVIAYSQRTVPPDVVEIPLPPDPVVAEVNAEAAPVAAEPISPAVPPAIAKPGVVKPAPQPREDGLIERLTRLESALARRTDREVELNSTRKFLDRLKSGTLTAEQRDQMELAAKRLEDTLTP